MKVLIIGSGAREHALSLAYEKSPKVDQIIVAPGNDFIAYKRDIIIDKDCSLNDPQSFLRIAKKYSPDLIDVAQDTALEKGTVDLLKENGFKVFGPTRDCARIEWDKKWSRELMQKYDIPHPEFKYFEDEIQAVRYAEQLYKNNPNRVIYVKATGLCAGKGALKSTNLKEAIKNIELMKTFPNDAGKIFLIEEGLIGEEFSYYAISDGKNYKIFKSAQDNKTVNDFDEGDQTGGMGAISPARVTDNIIKEIDEHQIFHAIKGMATEGLPYTGIMFLGGIVVDGKPMNIEYNARWGDPECHVVLPSIQTDYIDIIFACLKGNLDKIKIEQDNKSRICVVGTSKGYPDDYSSVKGKRIYGLEKVREMKHITILGAGIDVRDGKFYANGGRLFSIVAEGIDILEAKQRAYAAMAHISIEGNNLHYRTDIGSRDVERTLKDKFHI